MSGLPTLAPSPAVLRIVTATRYVTPLREGGSLPGLVEADDDGLYVAKFHGAGQGPKALIAELVAGELGRALGLLVPEIVGVELDPALGRSEPDEEIQDLLERSAGLNLGLDFLPGSLPFDPATVGRPGARLPGPGRYVGPPEPGPAADVVWFDALVTNVDRTARNVNLLAWHGRLWLIDHGAALYIHHTWRDPAAHARRPFVQIADHVLLPYAGPIPEADARLAPLVTRGLLESIAGRIPAAWLAEPGKRLEAGSVDARRRAYVDYLLTRMEPPRAFVEEADRARQAA